MMPRVFVCHCTPSWARLCRKPMGLLANDVTA